MTQLVYPANLPCPTSTSVSPAERRALSSLVGARQARDLWRDRLVLAAPIAFRFRSLEDVEQFVNWLAGDQVQAGAWFLATWRLPQGGSGVYRFVQTPGYPQFFAPGVWESQGVVEIRGRSLPPQSRRLICLDGPGDVAEYTVVSGNGGLFTNSTSPYGQSLDVASQNSGTVAKLSKPFVLADASVFQLRFKVDAVNSDDGAAVEWHGPSGSVLSFNPIREAALDATRRPAIAIEGETIIVLPTQVVVGEWYTMNAKLVAGAGNSFVSITRISTGAVVTTHSVGSLPPRDIDTLNIYDDQNGPTCPTRYASFHVCQVAA